MAIDIARRKFIAVLGSAAAWPLVAQAQQAAPRRIGVLLVGLSPQSKSVQSFLQGLARTIA